MGSCGNLQIVMLVVKDFCVTVAEVDSVSSSMGAGNVIFIFD